MMHGPERLPHYWKDTMADELPTSAWQLGPNDIQRVVSLAERQTPYVTGN